MQKWCILYVFEINKQLFHQLGSTFTTNRFDYDEYRSGNYTSFGLRNTYK